MVPTQFEKPILELLRNVAHRVWMGPIEPADVQKTGA